jgi:hypothetical protein
MFFFFFWLHYGQREREREERLGCTNLWFTSVRNNAILCGPNIWFASVRNDVVLCGSNFCFTSIRNDVVLRGRMDMGPSNLSLPINYCILRPNNKTLDCTAHSLLYDVASNTFRPLLFKTDTWCSSGSVDSDGTLIQTGGFNDGKRIFRKFIPCDDNAYEWEEFLGGLKDRRWYTSNQVLERETVKGRR